MNNYYTAENTRSTPENAYSIQRRKGKIFPIGPQKGLSKNEKSRRKKTSLENLTGVQVN